MSRNASGVELNVCKDTGATPDLLQRHTNVQHIRSAMTQYDYSVKGPCHGICFTVIGRMGYSHSVGVF
jgi:hypothetical protein